jgi:hypothetical protein
MYGTACIDSLTTVTEMSACPVLKRVYGEGLGNDKGAVSFLLFS